MFKLIKILNSGVNVPEPCRISKAPDTVLKAGTAIAVSEGLAVNCTATQAPDYITLAKAGESEESVLCYKVFPDMLFEVEASQSPASLNVGDKVTLGIDSDGAACSVTATLASGVAYVYSLDGATAAGQKITVKF